MIKEMGYSKIRGYRRNEISLKLWGGYFINSFSEMRLLIALSFLPFLYNLYLHLKKYFSDTQHKRANISTEDILLRIKEIGYKEEIYSAQARKIMVY